MKKKTKTKRFKQVHAQSLIWFVLTGAWHDVTTLCHVIMIPLQFISKHFAKKFERCGLNYERTHTTLCFMVGSIVLVLSFVLEKHFSDGLLARGSIETIRATAVCPLGEILYVITGATRRV